MKEQRKWKTLAIDEVIKEKLDKVMIMMGDKLTYSDIISTLIESYTESVRKKNQRI
jgi:hypothetical protein